ncbi:acetylornithine transaminase [Clavibacter michiganensis]|nr:acetylornithine transaminase [Clavibacter michiganensis]PPF62924.1 acetylornithine transaminase [Clavibacter michiganensis]
MNTETAWSDRFGDSLMKSMGSPFALLTRGEGCYVWDESGKQYLDFLAGIAVNSLGHAHPAFVDAVSRQAATLAHVSNYFTTAPQLELAERLKRITGAGAEGRVYFGNSGAEANEAAFKLARLNKTASRHRILAVHDSFHGRTMGALALTGKPALRDAFEPMPSGVEHIDSTIEALERSIDGSVSALILEPIKGEAGVVELPEGLLVRARELTAEHDVLLILDEIQTGAGRTGSWFAYEQFGIRPDAVTMAKGMGGGFPIGALVTFGWASELFQRGMHGSTFGGNPLATATANAVLAEIESAGLIQNAAVRGEEIARTIRDIGSPHVAEVRGRGLLIGVGLTSPVASAVSAAALDAGLIVNAANDSSIRIAPPLIVGDDEVRLFAERFRAALDAVPFD